MSQIWDIDQIVPASTSPSTDIQRIIDGFNALRSVFSGASEPASADQVAYMLWADMTTGLLKIRNAANTAWIVVGTLAAVNLGLLSLAGGNLTGGMNAAKTTVASATTPDIFAVTIGNTIDYTGTTTATGFATAPQAGCQRILVCAGAAVFTAGANMLIDGVTSGNNFTAAAGDKILVIAVTTAQVRLSPLKANGTAVSNLFPPMHMQGLIASINGADPTNDWDFSSGSCIDMTGVQPMVSGTITKQSDVAWAVGTSAGMLDTGAIGNNDYYVWQIKRSDTGIVDKLSSLSATAPTMPANYDFKRLIHWFKRVAGVNVLMDVQEIAGGGIAVNWRAPTDDISVLNTLTSTRRTDALKVPLAFSVLADITVLLDDVATLLGRICCPDETDAAPTLTVAPLFNIRQVTVGAVEGKNFILRTSATGTIAARLVAGTADRYQVQTNGFTWARRN